MVSLPSMVTAAVLQLCGISFFIHQSQDQCSPGPILANWLVVLTLLLVLWRCELPKRYLNFFPCFQICIELLGTIIISELSILLGWYTYERLVQKLTQRVSPCCRWYSYLLLYMLTMVPPIILLYIVAPAQWREFVVELVVKLPRPEADEFLVESVLELSNYVKGLVYFCQLRREDRLHTMRLIQLQAERRRTREPGTQMKLELES